jgi:two-component system, chemotaxis family, chemotaxis protein CheY
MTKILIVDDSPMVQKLFKRELEKHGFEADVSENGREALGFVAKNQYELIFTDLNMPFINGIDFTRKVRLLENYKDVPIVLVSSDSMPERKKEAKDAGASGWITKPFDSEKILAQVKHFISI